MSYAALAAIAIQSNQNDQHGGQSIPAFDYYMAPGVLKTFKKEFKQELSELLTFEDLREKLSTPNIIISATGLATWEAVEGANSYAVDVSTYATFQDTQGEPSFVSGYLNKVVNGTSAIVESVDPDSTLTTRITTDLLPALSQISNLTRW